MNGGLKMKKKLISLAFLSSLFLSTSLSAGQTNDLSTYKPARDNGMAIGNIIGDEKPDILYITQIGFFPKDETGKRISKEYHRVIVYENLGNGNYEKHLLKGLELPYHPMGGNYYQISIEDMDCDGLKDIIAKDKNYLSIFKNKGDLKFEEIKLESK
ncbi:MAG: hypothetical protein L6408_01285 [Nanoarchaeota archaeon]|nr:hypothetical protein [Nanoarchaeota archaeon]